MNDDTWTITEEPIASAVELGRAIDHSQPGIPAYLEKTYWWAYLRPRAIWIFEREWLVNLILWGQMRCLTDAVLAELDCREHDAVLQVACVYGDFSRRLAAHLEGRQSKLHILDIAPIQLRNVRDKLRDQDNVSLHHQDSGALTFSAECFDQTVVFFLLHEQPKEVRLRTIDEALRVTRPGGKVIFVDYHQPRWFNPLRYLMRPVLRWLEPFALDMWKKDFRDFLPAEISSENVSTQLYCGGLYQKVVIQR